MCSLASCLPRPRFLRATGFVLLAVIAALILFFSLRTKGLLTPLFDDDPPQEIQPLPRITVVALHSGRLDLLEMQYRAIAAFFPDGILENYVVVNAALDRSDGLLTNMSAKWEDEVFERFLASQGWGMPTKEKIREFCENRRIAYDAVGSSAWRPGGTFEEGEKKIWHHLVDSYVRTTSGVVLVLLEDTWSFGGSPELEKLATDEFEGVWFVPRASDSESVLLGEYPSLVAVSGGGNHDLSSWEDKNRLLEETTCSSVSPPPEPLFGWMSIELEGTQPFCITSIPSLGMFRIGMTTESDSVPSSPNRRIRRSLQVAAAIRLQMEEFRVTKTSSLFGIDQLIDWSRGFPHPVVFGLQFGYEGGRIHYGLKNALIEFPRFVWDVVLLSYKTLFAPDQTNYVNGTGTTVTVGRNVIYRQYRKLFEDEDRGFFCICDGDIVPVEGNLAREMDLLLASPDDFKRVYKMAVQWEYEEVKEWGGIGPYADAALNCFSPFVQDLLLPYYDKLDKQSVWFSQMILIWEANLYNPVRAFEAFPGFAANLGHEEYSRLPTKDWRAPGAWSAGFDGFYDHIGNKLPSLNISGGCAYQIVKFDVGFYAKDVLDRLCEVNGQVLYTYTRREGKYEQMFNMTSYGIRVDPKTEEIVALEGYSET